MGNDEIKRIRSQKFFSDLNRVNCTQNLQGNPDDLNEKIALKSSITGIEKGAHYSIQLFSVFGQSNTPLNEPEQCVIDEITNTAVLTTSIIIQYYFEKEQKMMIIITKTGTSPRTFRIDTTLGCVMGSRKNTLIKKIPEANGEILNIAAEKIKNTEDILILRLNVTPKQKVNFSESKNKLVFHMKNNSGEPIYYSECLSNLGKFNEVKIPGGIVSNGIILSFINNHKKVVSEIHTNINELSNKKQFDVMPNKSKAYSIISNSILTRNYTFVDYLKAGVQIGLSIAIDFTGSNGNPSDPRSLHFTGGQEPNQYERAIYACGNIMAYYDYDQLFPCYGFGAKINNTPTPLFNLNFQQDPNINLIPNVIQEYHKALSLVKLWGPTHFGPILKATNDMIRAENDKLKYNVLMILTDGMIDDVDNTINELVAGSFLPLSVIIIGVGKADFTTMNVLDADDNPLKDSRGTLAARDLVQFVPFLKYESNPERLAQEVLAEIPRQIIEYYQQNNLDPVKLTT